jgi:hypothetical protein
MQALALLLFRSYRLDDLIDLTRSQSTGLVPLGLFANDFENLGLRRGKFDPTASMEWC